jgi:fermentation-respiration switch protein FrsA (DUF1100 family)
MKKLALVLSAWSLGGCTYLFYHPNSVVYQKPETLGLQYETPTFPSLDGTKLTGIFFHSKKQPAEGTVIHVHGNGGNITSQWGYSAWLAEKGFNVFVFDFRGYGASEGKPTEHGTVLDAAAALNYIRTRPDVDGSKLVVLGQSLGGAVAVSAVAISTPGVRAIALDSPFSGYRSIAREKLSTFWLTTLFKRPLTWLLISDRENPSKALPKLPKIPLVVFHAPYDPVVPYSEGLKVYQAANDPKSLWVVPGDGHAEALTRYGSTYRPKLVEFFEAALR